MNDDRDFARRIGRALERQTVDAETRKALLDARRKALDEAASPARLGWAPVAAVGGLALLVAAALLSWREAPRALPDIGDDALAVIAAEEELELLQEWEFYVWFDEQPGASG